MCEAIARRVADRAAGRHVVRVVIQVGHLRQVVPDAMAFAWEMLTAATDLEGADLDIEHVPATVACAVCATITTLTAPVMVCGSCGSDDVELRSGDELILVYLELEDPAVPSEVG